MKVRICNRCEHEYTEQLKTLNETGRKTTEDMAGKCHGRVSALRVKPGRVFPGFREYFRGGDKRPGIGRVTVQVVGERPAWKAQHLGVVSLTSLH